MKPSLKQFSKSLMEIVACLYILFIVRFLVDMLHTVLLSDFFADTIPFEKNVDENTAGTRCPKRTLNLRGRRNAFLLLLSNPDKFRPESL
jgi:hypothetical protein